MKTIISKIEALGQTINEMQEIISDYQCQIALLKTCCVDAGAKELFKHKRYDLLEIRRKNEGTTNE